MNVRRRVFVASVLSLLLLPMGFAPPRSADAAVTTTVVEVPVVADTFLDKTAPDTPRGTAQKLLANGNDGWARKILLKFDASAIPEGVVQSAELVINRDNARFQQMVVSVTDAGWSEASATWNSPPQVGALVGTFDPPFTPRTWAVPLGPVVAGPGVYSFLVETTSTTDPLRIYAREASSGASSLRLTIEEQAPPPPPPPDGSVEVVKYVDVLPSVDGSVGEAFPDTSRGAWKTLYVSGVSGAVSNALLKFDLTDLPQGVIDSADLILDRNPLPWQPLTVSATDSSWGESSIRWATAPEPLEVLADVAPNPRQATTKIPLGAAAAENRILSLRVSTDPGAGEMRISSRESQDAPILRVGVRVYGDPPCEQSGVTLSDKLVPSCGVLWGAIADAKSEDQGPDAHREWEQTIGRTFGVYSSYHVADYRFPSERELELAREPGNERILLMNWRVAEGSTWAAVARGELDARIDAQIAHIKELGFTEPFLLTLHQEMEPEVINTPGSGMEPSDYADMFRYVITKFRSEGITNAVSVMAYLGYPNWVSASWFDELWPGEEYVDWISWDPYTWAPFDYWSPDSLTSLLTFDGGLADYEGFYDYMTAKYPGIPLLLGEWGMYERPVDLQECDAARRTGTVGSAACQPALASTDRAEFYHNVKADLPLVQRDFPMLKAMLYFESEWSSWGPTKFWNNSPVMQSFDDAEALAAFQELSQSPLLVNPPQGP